MHLRHIFFCKYDSFCEKKQNFIFDKTKKEGKLPFPLLNIQLIMLNYCNPQSIPL